jgi:hypothetical protein
MPILHVYYNRHFSKSRQWQGFLDVIEETEYEAGSYARIMLTDCEYEKSKFGLIEARKIWRVMRSRGPMRTG